MKYLVHCPCAHTIDAHRSSGCTGARFQPCGCRRSSSEALDAAIDAVRSTYGDEGAEAGKQAGRGGLSGSFSSR